MYESARILNFVFLFDYRCWALGRCCLTKFSFLENRIHLLHDEFYFRLLWYLFLFKMPFYNITTYRPVVTHSWPQPFPSRSCLELPEEKPHIQEGFFSPPAVLFSQQQLTFEILEIRHAAGICMWKWMTCIKWEIQLLCVVLNIWWVLANIEICRKHMSLGILQLVESCSDIASM